MNKIKINKKQGLFLSFAFAMVATLTFLFVANMIKSSALTTTGFNPADIISDAVMGNYSSMSESNIQSFLKSKNSCNDTNISKRNNYPQYYYHIENGHFVCMADESFNGESAAHIIWQAAQDYRINPQVLIVTLQKEQGLITDTWPNNNQYNKAMGYGCPDTAPCDDQYYGLRNQVRQAASHFHRVLTGEKTSSSYRVGNSYVQYNPNAGCGGTTLNIQNRATVSLYIYTPYQPNAAALSGGGDGCSAYGNRNFYSYFTEWFGDTHAINNIKSVYVAEGVYTFNTATGKVLGFNGTDNGVSAQIMENNGSDFTKFILEKDEYQYYRIKHVASNRYIDVSNADTNDGAKVQIWNGNTTCAQKWTIEIINDNSYRLRSACSFKSLDVNNGTISNIGAKVQIWTGNTTNAQQWILTNTNNAPISNGTYNIKVSENKSLALSSETSTNNGVKLVTGETHAATTERFQITRNTDGFYKIMNVASGKYLDVENANDSDGTAIQIWDKNTTCAQRWAVKKVDSGYKISAACSGKAIDINNGNVNTENTKVQIWTHNTTPAQVFNFTNPMGSAIDDGVYTIESGLNNFYLDSKSVGDVKDGDNLQIWALTGKDNQQFQVTYNQNTGYYTIGSIKTGRTLDVANAVKNNGGNIQNWTYNNTCAQHWMIKKVNNENYRIMSACSRLSMDVSNASAKNGTNVQVWGGNTTAAQQWKFHKTTTSDVVSTITSDQKTYRIESALNPNIGLSAADTSIRNGVNIVINQSNTNNSKWQLKQIGSFYQIINKASGLALDITNANSNDGTNLQSWTLNNTCAQKWRLSRYDDEYYVISSTCNNKVIDVANANTISGTNVWIWTRNNTAAQRWKLIEQ